MYSIFELFAGKLVVNTYKLQFLAIFFNYFYLLSCFFHAVSERAYKLRALVLRTERKSTNAGTMLNRLTGFFSTSLFFPFFH